MIIALSILALLAVVSAIGAVSQVQRQRAGKAPAPVAAQRQRSPISPPPSTATPAPQTSAPDADPAPAPSPDTAAVVESLIAMQPDIPLAASLTVSEVVDPHARSRDSIETNEHDSAGVEEAIAAPAHSHNLLTELSALEHAGVREQVAHLSQYLEHPDEVMRAATAFTLGELAAQHQGQERDEILAMLIRLSHDASTQVRQQAAAALGGLDQSSILPAEN